MKKRFFSMAVAMISMLAITFSLTSCEDVFVAQTLEGTWSGNMYQEYYYGGQYYEPTRTEVCFLRDPYRYNSGDGYWVDYFDSWVPWNSRYIANHINWEVRNGIIYVYLYEDNIEFTIRRYSLSDGYFTGELYGSDGSMGQFRLRHTSSPNWNSYSWGYNDYWYTKGERQEDGTMPEAPMRPIRVSK